MKFIATWKKMLLLDEALELLIAGDLIQVEHFAFGHPIYSRAELFSNKIYELRQDRSKPFYAASIRGGDIWLRNALTGVNQAYDALEIDRSDFANPDGEWEPIPVDRDDPKLKEAIATLDDTIEKVRSDNGYNATFRRRSHMSSIALPRFPRS